MTDNNRLSGVIENFADYKTMTEWNTMFDRHFSIQELGQPRSLNDIKNDFEPEQREILGKTKGVDKNHKGYLWFKVKILDKIQEHFDKEFKLIYGHFMHSEKPLVEHQDCYPELLPEGCKSYYSFLIPYSVDNDPEKCFHAATVIFKPGKMSKENYELHASHCSKDIMEELDIDSVHTWRMGDLIWWDNEAWHGSNNFTLSCKSKQALVIHTYV